MALLIHSNAVAGTSLLNIGAVTGEFASLTYQPTESSEDLDQYNTLCAPHIVHRVLPILTLSANAASKREIHYSLRY